MPPGASLLPRPKVYTGASVPRRLLAGTTDLFAVMLPHTAAKDCKILRDRPDQPPIHLPEPGHDPVSRCELLVNAVEAATRDGKGPIFHKCPFIKEESQPLPCRQLSLGMLTFHTFFASALLPELLFSAQLHLFFSVLFAHIHHPLLQI